MKDFHLMKTKNNDEGSHQVTEPVGVHDLTKQTCPETNDEENNRNTCDKTQGLYNPMPANLFPKKLDGFFLIAS